MTVAAARNMVSAEAPLGTTEGKGIAVTKAGVLAPIAIAFEALAPMKATDVPSGFPLIALPAPVLFHILIALYPAPVASNVFAV